MCLVVLQADASAPDEHLKWDEELKEHEQHPYWDHVCRPEEEEGIEHVEHADEGNHAIVHFGSSLDVEQLMQLFSLLFLAHAEDDHVQEGSQTDDHEYQHVPIVLHFVDCRNEEVSFEEQRDDQHGEAILDELVLLYLPPLHDEPGRFT